MLDKLNTYMCQILFPHRLGLYLLIIWNMNLPIFLLFFAFNFWKIKNIISILRLTIFKIHNFFFLRLIISIQKKIIFISLLKSLSTMKKRASRLCHMYGFKHCWCILASFVEASHFSCPCLNIYIYITRIRYMRSRREWSKSKNKKSQEGKKIEKLKKKQKTKKQKPKPFAGSRLPISHVKLQWSCSHTNVVPKKCVQTYKFD